jgi:hypothetical protein
MHDEEAVTNDIRELIDKVMGEPRKPKELEALERIARYARNAKPQSMEQAMSDLAIVRMMAEEILEPDHLYPLPRK